MTSAEAGDFETVLGAAVLLHENGQSTDMTLIAVQRLNRGLGLTSVAIPSWTSMTLATDEPTRLRVVPVAPVAVNMRRVAAAMQAIDRVEDGTLDRRLMRRELADAAAESGSAALPFVIACALGAAALSVVFGVSDVRAIALIAVSAAAGADAVACWLGGISTRSLRPSPLRWWRGWAGPSRRTWDSAA